MKILFGCLLSVIYGYGQKEIQKLPIDSTVKKAIVLKKSTVVYTPHFLYKTKQGDTYFSVAKANNLTISELYELNAINNSNVLLIGTSLFIQKKHTKKKRNTTFYHIVNKEETLYSIAKKYNTTVKQLMVLNKLNANIVFINQKLLVK